MNKRDKARDRYLQRVYGISLSTYNEILRKQGGGCAICHKTPEEEGRNLAVDHLHVKGGGGPVRGLCCSWCNYRLIGRHKDPELLRRVADYLSQHTGYFTPLKVKKTKKRHKKIKKHQS